MYSVHIFEIIDFFLSLLSFLLIIALISDRQLISFCIIDDFTLFSTPSSLPSFPPISVELLYSFMNLFMYVIIFNSE